MRFECECHTHNARIATAIANSLPKDIRISVGFGSSEQVSFTLFSFSGAADTLYRNSAKKISDVVEMEDIMTIYGGQLRSKSPAARNSDADFANELYYTPSP
jgi:hypothetical protein